MKKIIWGATMLAAAAAFGADNPAAKPPASLFDDPVIARGKGVEVRQSQVDDAFVTFKANRAAMGQTISEDLRPKIEADILDKLIATQLFLARSTDADRAKGKETAGEFIADQIKQSGSQESFERQVRAMGLTPEKFRSQINEQALVKAVIDREIKSKKSVSGAEMKSFYDKNPNLFEEPESVRVSHILFSTQDPATGKDLMEAQKIEKRQMAEKVLALVKAGGDFAGLVRQYSEDRTSRDRGGEYTIARSPRSEVPEFEAAAFSLKPNQISDIVTTKFGYHIIKGGEKFPAKKQDFAKVEDKIKETLLQQEVEKELPAFVENLKKQAGVEIIGSRAKR